MTHLKHITLAVVASATLVACDGGGSNNAATPALVTAAYAGNWKGACEVGSSNVTTSSGASLNKVDFYTMTPVSDTTITSVQTIKYYAVTDNTCIGTAVITEAHAAKTMTIFGTTTISSQLVDKISIPDLTTVNSIVSGGITLTNANLNTNAVSINGYTYVQGYFSVDTGSHNYLFRPTATSIYCGDDATRTGALGLPTAMLTTACLTKN